LQLIVLIYRPGKDERLTWPGCLTYSEQFTHVSGHSSEQRLGTVVLAEEISIVCVIAAAVAVVRRGLRSVWDAFVFHAVIKKRGLIPSCDGFTVRRIAGPGLASSYFFQVTAPMCLSCVFYVATDVTVTFELFCF